MSKRRKKNRKNPDNSQQLLKKREEIKSLLKSLEIDKFISKILIQNDESEVVSFCVEINGKWVELRFVMFPKQDKDYFTQATGSTKGIFFIGMEKNIEDLKKAVLEYIHSINKGFTLERLCALALGELKNEGKIRFFLKTKSEDDIRMKDFIIGIFNKDSLEEFPIQVKSSYNSLLLERDILLQQGIAGLFYKSTGNDKKDIKKIKDKILAIIEAHKRGEIIFI